MHGFIHCEWRPQGRIDFAVRTTILGWQKVGLEGRGQGLETRAQILQLCQIQTLLAMQLETASAQA